MPLADEILLHSPAEIIRHLLIDYELGVYPRIGLDRGDWPVYATNEPDKIDNVIIVLDQTGITSGRSMFSGEDFTHHGVQILVRGATHSVGYPKANTVRETLLREVYRDTVTIDGNSYFVPCISKVSAVLPLGVDSPSTGRHRFSINLTTPLHRSET